MRLFLMGLALFSVTACSTTSQQTTQTPAETSKTQMNWEVSEKIDTPESTYFDPQNNIVFVSNISGAPDKKDGKGWISKLGQDGKMIQDKWITGLNAPKGMRSDGKTLWVTDIDQVLAIDISKGKIQNRIRVTGAKFLNDVALGPKGEIYVSDTMGGRIYLIQGRKVSVFAEGPQLESPNGLTVQGDKLVVAGWGTETKPDFSTTTLGSLYTLDLKTKEKTPITKTPLGNLDGLEVDTQGRYLVTDWMAGKVYRVQPTGEVTLLLEGFKGAADIAFIPGSNTLLVPRMMENKISSYQTL